MNPLALCQFKSGTQKGHYESYFLRANHPSKPQAFWIRYTIFSPKSQPENAIGEIWAMYFDADNKDQKVIAIQEDIPLNQCSFSSDTLALKLGNNTLIQGLLSGGASLNHNIIEWNIGYGEEHDPILLLPKNLYSTPIPKAKLLVTNPNAIFNGSLNVNGSTIEICNWQGSENHNWGSKHTDEYAWGQVAGFDNHANAFLECSTARIKLGPIWSPWMTLAVLVIDDERYAFNSITQAFQAQGEYDFFNWTFSCKNKSASLNVTISAPKEHFAGLRYKNPPGGSHTCLNSKIAQCELTLKRKNKETIILKTSNRAAFEILTDQTDHGIKIRNPSNS